MNEFGKKVAIEAIKKDMSMAQLRRAANISTGAWTTATTKRPPTYNMAKRICDALEIDGEIRDEVLSLSQPRKSTGKFITFRSSKLSDSQRDAIKRIYAAISTMDDNLVGQAVKAVYGVK